MKIKVTDIPTTFNYLGNKSTGEVHYIPCDTTMCHLDKIIKSGNGVVFIPDTIEEAYSCDYDSCVYCTYFV